MSKMSDLAQQLDEQCVDYGFTSYTEALEQGFTYKVAEDGTATLTPPSNGLEMAHEAWLKERDYHVDSLRQVAELLDVEAMPGSAGTIRQAAKFLGECHD